MDNTERIVFNNILETKMEDLNETFKIIIDCISLEEQKFYQKYVTMDIEDILDNYAGATEDAYESSYLSALAEEDDNVSSMLKRIYSKYSLKDIIIPAIKNCIAETYKHNFVIVLLLVFCVGDKLDWCYFETYENEIVVMPEDIDLEI